MRPSAWSACRELGVSRGGIEFGGTSLKGDVEQRTAVKQKRLRSMPLLSSTMGPDTLVLEIEVRLFKIQRRCPCRYDSAVECLIHFVHAGVAYRFP